jgi:hypothetical protein
VNFQGIFLRLGELRPLGEARQKPGKKNFSADDVDDDGDEPSSKKAKPQALTYGDALNECSTMAQARTDTLS